MPVSARRGILNVGYSRAALYVNVTFASVIIAAMLLCVAAAAYFLYGGHGMLADAVGLRSNPLVQAMMVAPLLAVVVIVARAAASIRWSLGELARNRPQKREPSHRAVSDK